MPYHAPVGIAFIQMAGHKQITWFCNTFIKQLHRDELILLHGKSVSNRQRVHIAIVISNL